VDEEINAAFYPTRSRVLPHKQSLPKAGDREASHMEALAVQAVVPQCADPEHVRLSRRDLLAVGTAVAFAGFAPGFTRPAEAQEFKISGIKALVFDVYGTCTDYWGTIVSEGQAINLRKRLSIDWSEIATDWHGLFPPSFEAVLKGQRPWQSFASLRLEALRNVLHERGISGFSEDELGDINAVWQRAEPWPDSLPGLARLKRRYILASLSNADMADMVKLAKLRGMPWDVILASELAKAVKPDARVYQLAAQYLGLKPEEIMMVACHKADLLGAKAQGFRTAFVRRPLETGPRAKVDISADAQFDLNAATFVELAELLQA
jgi:2-haloacid dehalogenase